MSELVRGTSEWWLDRLGTRLTTRALELQRYDDYYTGKQGRRFIGTKYRELFAKLFETYAENFCGIVVDAVAERLEVEGFRFPFASDAEPEPDEAVATDPDAWRIWQDNGLDANSQIAHTESLVKGVVYVLVSPFRSEMIAERSPRITIEDACETIVEYRPGTRDRIVGMKRWWDDAEERYFATLYYPDRIEKWVAQKRPYTVWANQHGRQTGEKEQWKPRIVAGEEWPLAHELGVVPLVPLINRPRLKGEGESEIGSVIPIQDAINTLAINELVASEAGSFPQKWATGIEIPNDPQTGKPLEPWKPDIDRILSTAVPDARFGQFTAADLAQWGGAIDRRVKRIASITRTPYHYFLDHGGQPPSGESLKSAETGLVRKTRLQQRHKGEGWEEVERLSFKVLGDPRADVLDSETVWAEAESVSEAEHVDALVKMGSLGVPEEVLWQRWGATPSEIERWRALREAEQLAEARRAPPLPPPPPNPGIPADAGANEGAPA